MFFAIERQIGGSRIVIQAQAEQTGVFDRHHQFVGGLLQDRYSMTVVEQFAFQMISRLFGVITAQDDDRGGLAETGGAFFSRYLRPFFRTGVAGNHAGADGNAGLSVDDDKRACGQASPKVR